ncbi:hypothetical protein SAMN04488001_3121 [Litoreibacter albidus]|uniref:Uncharacterized protein n=1 Tax=Litoreibacter albidus TaxID=670155 RepID=A0A1H3BF52_9RHOB|nr:hypothetical protein SAMN04488001_3121 [Litoreibacter albidus]
MNSRRLVFSSNRTNIWLYTASGQENGWADLVDRIAKVKRT